jgi:hypothetical protein
MAYLNIYTKDHSSTNIFAHLIDTFSCLFSIVSTYVFFKRAVSPALYNIMPTIFIKSSRVSTSIYIENILYAKVPLLNMKGQKIL